MHFSRCFGLLGALLGALSTAHAARYDVGPAPGQLPRLSDVPWGGLQPGDVVNIHGKPGGYREIIQISASGTAAQPIVIRGIPDPVTQVLPVIDGDGAVMDPRVDFRNPIFERMGLIVVSPRAKGYVYGQTFPSHLVIESLDLRNALYDPAGTIRFTDPRGAVRLYDAFACGIYVEFARNLTIRGCEISRCGNGIFANSKNGAAQATTGLLIEKNHLHSNGQPIIAGQSNGFAHHNIYAEAVGAVYQFNRFGPLRPGCFGCMIKDRSSGTVIRYNEVVTTDASNVFAILDPQGGSGHIDTQPDYRDAFVYGNSITLLATPSHGNINLVWFGAFNGPNSYAALHRGTLHFYHNTVVNHQTGVAAFSLTTPDYSGTGAIHERVDVRNNIFFTDTAINANIYQAFRMVITPASPVISFGLNWVSPGTRPTWIGHPFGGIINGWENLITGSFGGQNIAGFLSPATLDYRLKGGSDSIDAAGPLAPAVLARGHAVTQEYLAPQSSSPRALIGARSDLGAFETSATYLPPASNRRPTAGSQTLNRSGAVTIPITLAGADADGDALDYAVTLSSSQGTLTGTPPHLTYKANGAAGFVTLTYQVSDGYTASKPGHVFLGLNYPGYTPPTVALTSPATPVTVAAPASVMLQATASAPTGIQRVEYHAGTTLLGSATQPPYAVVWTSRIPGTYTVVARAFDNAYARAVSDPIVVTVE
jgi:hypothetical protein